VNKAQLQMVPQNRQKDDSESINIEDSVRVEEVKVNLPVQQQS
jgi:hypothetical protein